MQIHMHMAGWHACSSTIAVNHGTQASSARADQEASPVHSDGISPRVCSVGLQSLQHVFTRSFLCFSRCCTKRQRARTAYPVPVPLMESLVEPVKEASWILPCTHLSASMSPGNWACIEYSFLHRL